MLLFDIVRLDEPTLFERLSERREKKAAERERHWHAAAAGKIDAEQLQREMVAGQIPASPTPGFDPMMDKAARKHADTVLALVDEALVKAARAGYGSIAFNTEYSDYGCKARAPELHCLRSGGVGGNVPETDCHVMLHLGVPGRGVLFNRPVFDGGSYIAWRRAMLELVYGRLAEAGTEPDVFNSHYVTCNWAEPGGGARAKQIASEPAMRAAFDAGVPMEDIVP